MVRLRSVLVGVCASGVLLFSPVAPSVRAADIEFDVPKISILDTFGEKVVEIAVMIAGGLTAVTIMQRLRSNS